MKIVIVNGSARKGNTLDAIDEHKKISMVQKLTDASSYKIRYYLITWTSIT